MLARKKPVDEQDLGDLDVEATQVGEGAAIVLATAIDLVPPRAAGVVVDADDPSAMARFADLVKETGVLEGGSRG
jgi:hypothetical protein